MAFCTKCGTEIPLNAVFCPKCGNATTTSQPPAPVNGPCREHIVMVLSILVGYLGLDRFYNKQVGLGVLKLITGGGFAVWWLVDAAYYTYKAGEIRHP
jgi:hypothetical protein